MRYLVMLFIAMRHLGQSWRRESYPVPNFLLVVWIMLGQIARQIARCHDEPPSTVNGGQDDMPAKAKNGRSARLAFAKARVGTRR